MRGVSRTYLAIFAVRAIGGNDGELANSQSNATACGQAICRQLPRFTLSRLNQCGLAPRIRFSASLEITKINGPKNPNRKTKIRRKR